MANLGGSHLIFERRLEANDGHGEEAFGEVRIAWTWQNRLSYYLVCWYLGVGRAARFDDLGVMPWILRLRYEKEITFVEPQQDLMLGRILAETRVPPLELVESIQLEEINVKPRPCLTLRTPRQNWGLAADKLLGELEFDYDGAIIPAGRTTPLAVSTELRSGYSS